MKLLIISDAWHPQINGVVRTYEYLAEEIEKAGHTVKVIGPADFKRTISMPGYSEIKLALWPYKALERMIDAYKPSAIHIATEGPLGNAARKYCLRHDRLFTTSFHTHFPDYIAKRAAKICPLLYKPFHAMAKSFIRRFHAPASAMMIATQSLEDELRSWDFKTPISRLTRGVNLSQFFPGEKTLFNDLPRPISIYVGRVAIEKNIEKFLEMQWEGSKVIVGDGPSMQELKDKYPDAVFVGPKVGEELAAHYRSADLFVFPSKTDTFGIVLIEALASGLPVAAYDVTGPKDIITEDFLGTLTQDEDLSQAAAKAIKAPGSAQKRADHVKNYYTWETAADQFLTTVKDIRTVEKKRA